MRNQILTCKQFQNMKLLLRINITIARVKYYLNLCTTGIQDDPDLLPYGNIPTKN